ncbi:MAG: winged helix-turn-helix domain-containing protein [Erythrobacter sp.]|nr:winged helix-turn-helix domain-containing protein [Erythrobacter sp.]
MGWSFEDFELDADAFELRKAGEPVAAEPQVLSLLILLVENQGKLLTKDAIVESIWDGRAISDAALSSRVKSARQLLGDDGKAQRFIKTVHGRGFRFVGEAAETSDRQSGTVSENPSSTAKPTVEPGSSRSPWQRGWPYAAFGLACVAIFATLAYLYGNPSGRWATNDQAVAIAVMPFSGPADEEAFGREVAAAIVTDLSDRRDFAMVSSTSSFSLAERGLTVAEIAEELGATHALEGDVRRMGEGYSVDLRLVETSTQRQIWSGAVERGDVLKPTLVKLVVLHSAAAIQAHLEVGAGRVDIPDGTPEDAIRDYRIAIETELSFNRRAPRLYQYQLLESAREKAPNWADAHGAFAYTVVFTHLDTLALSFEEHQEAIRDGIAKAKAIDPNNRWTRLADGVFQTRYGTDLGAALEILRDLVEDEPEWPLARRLYAQALVLGGDYRAALNEFDQIDSLNAVPTSVGNFIRTQALRGLGTARNSKDLAMACDARCFWLFSGWFEAILIANYPSRERFERDLEELAAAMRRANIDIEAADMGFDGNMTANMGATARYLKGYGPIPERSYGRPTILAQVDMRKGDVEAAIAHFEVLKLDWMPANAVNDLVHDDAMGLPERVRTDPRYVAIFDRPHFRAVEDYRRAKGLTAGLPDRR